MKVKATVKIEVGDRVEYVSVREKENPSGVIGIVTGFYDKDTVFVLSETGHRWALQTNLLKKR